MIVLDASVVIGFMSRQDDHHDAARAILGARQEFIIHTVTMAEILVGAIRVGRGASLRARLVDLGIEEAERLDSEAEELAAMRVATGLGIPDCCPLLLAHAHAADLATTDMRLARAARGRGLEVLDGSV